MLARSGRTVEAVSFSSQGFQGTSQGLRRRTDCDILNKVYPKLNRADKSVLVSALKIARRHNVDTHDLAMRVQEWREWEDMRSYIERSFDEDEAKFSDNGRAKRANANK